LTKYQILLAKIETMCFNKVMENENVATTPTHCPVCNGQLLVTRLECASCATDVNGRFALGNLAGLREPHASLIEMFLAKRGNVKEMERELGLSYPTVRARLEEALEAAGYPKEVSSRGPGGSDAWEARFEADLADRIRARVEERLTGLGRHVARAERVARPRPVQPSRRESETRREAERDAERSAVLEKLERGELTAEEATAALREIRDRR
jgi:hypothetical protein